MGMPSFAENIYAGHFLYLAPSFEFPSPEAWTGCQGGGLAIKPDLKVDPEQDISSWNRRSCVSSISFSAYKETSSDRESLQNYAIIMQWKTGRVLVTY